MAYAIIRNANYKKDNLAGLYKHNERKNTNYSNKDIDKTMSAWNFSIKQCNTTYTNRLKQLIKEYDLKGRIISTTNVICEYIITSGLEFFEGSTYEEIYDYFKCAYEFVCQYNNLGEEFIVSAKVHMDENTPHMHLVYIPVMHKLDKKSGKTIHKIACSEYWKGKDSYHRLQDSFYKWVTERGFDLERGKERDIEHLSVEKFKKTTDYEKIMEEVVKDDIEIPMNLENENKAVIIEEHRKLYGYCKDLKFKLLKASKTLKHCEVIEKENINLKKQVEELKEEKSRLELYIENAFEVVKNVLNFPINTFKRLIDNLIKSSNELDNLEYTNEEIEFPEHERNRYK